MTLRDEFYYKEQDSFCRTKEAWFDDIPKHIAAFLKKGGKITQCEPGEGVYAKRYEDGTAARHFVIKRGKE
jgi:hypothetical protein